MTLSTPVYVAFLFAVLMWFSSTMRHYYIDVYRAGVLPRAWSAKVASAGAALGAFACAVSPMHLDILSNIIVVTSCASITCGAYIAVMAEFHGLDSQAAKWLLAHELAARKVLPEDAFQNPARLQVYLDHIYGRGRVSAQEMLARKGATAT